MVLIPFFQIYAKKGSLNSARVLGDSPKDNSISKTGLRQRPADWKDRKKQVSIPNSAPAFFILDVYKRQAHMIERMETRNAVHILEHGEAIGLASREYELICIDE